MTSSDPLVLSILTFNIWGLPGWIAKNKDDRVMAISKVINGMNLDIVCMQEVWIESDYQHLKSSLKVSLPYSHYFYSGVTGSGLCIFSKWPIMEILFHQWPLNGYIHMIHHGDWFGGKGVGLVVLDVAGYRVNVYTAHLHAQYHETDSYLVHRVEQAFDTAMFIRMTSGLAHFSLLAGDLNAPPGSICEQLLLHVAKLTDSYIAHTQDCSGGTNDCLRNSYSNPELVKDNPNGLRIDYILYKSSSTIQSDILSYSFPLETRIPGQTFSYSDHEAVLSKFRITRNPAAKSSFLPDLPALEKSLSEGISICTSALEETTNKSTFYWAAAATLFCSLLLTPLIFEFPLLHSKLYFFLLIVFIVLTVFIVLMATIWCKLEFHGILGARDRMLILFEKLKK